MASSQKNSDGYDSMKESGRGQFKNSKFSAQKDNLSEIRESEGQEADESHLNIIIEKEIVDEKIKKHIKFKDKETNHHYTESVQLIDFYQFQSLFNQVGLQITETYGNYDLSAYDEVNSDRLIIFAKKL